MKKLIIIAILNTLTTATIANAAIVPGPADVSRVNPRDSAPIKQNYIDHDNGIVTIYGFADNEKAPDDAKEVKLFLKHLDIEGMSVFKKEDLEEVNSEIGKNNTLDVVWEIANKITKRYQDAGYFLSRAYVPTQTIENGVVNIKIIEGYIAEVEFNNELGNNHIVESLAKRLKSHRPITSEQLEDFLLKINDLPGLSFRTILSPFHNETNDGVKLIIEASLKENHGSIQLDNYSSRYLGPHQVTATYDFSLVPLHHTVLTGLSAIPTDRLRYGEINHSMAIAPDLTLGFNAGITQAFPKYNLKILDIDSNSKFVAVTLGYQWKRGRQENIAFKLYFDARNINLDLLKAPFVRDRIRAIRAEAAYDYLDGSNAYNQANLTISQGLNIWGASSKNYYSSRVEAKPDFRKLELTLLRKQNITSNWQLSLAGIGQVASGSLYSAEEFGYGGQGFGRAYDPSEITGDRGVSASAELNYEGCKWNETTVSPYIFYDLGYVWNYDDDQPKNKYGASSGVGVRFSLPSNISANLGLAFPISHKISNPIYGKNQHSPRILAQVSKEF